jgi:hypothetical protein
MENPCDVTPPLASNGGISSSVGSVEPFSTTVLRALPRHIGQTAVGHAVNALSGVNFEAEGAQNWAQRQKARMRQLAN